MTGGTREPIDNAKIIQDFERHKYRHENPLSVRERIEWYINLAETRLEIALRKLENEPDVETLYNQQNALVKKLKNTFKESSKQEIRKEFHKIKRKIKKLVDAQVNPRAMVREAKAALKLFEANDIERALRAYDSMHEYRSKADLPLRESVEQSNKAKGPRNRGREPRRAMLKAICEERDTFKFLDMVEYLGRFDNPLACKSGAGALYGCWFDGERYHFKPLGGVPDTFTRRDISIDLSVIRNAAYKPKDL